MSNIFRNICVFAGIAEGRGYSAGKKIPKKRIFHLSPIKVKVVSTGQAGSSFTAVAKLITYYSL